MRSSRRRRIRPLKWILTAVIVLSLSIVIALFVRYQSRHDAADTAPAESSEEATISVDRVEHIATRHGRVEWRLSADAVRYLNAQKKAVFEEVAITFFTRRDEEIRLVARKGELDTETQDIRISGDVRVTGSGYRLETPELRYDHNRKIFIADEGVRVESDGQRLSADAMTFYMENNKADLRGNVEGVIRESIDF